MLRVPDVNVTHNTGLTGISSFSMIESTCLPIRGMVFRDEGVDLTAVLYICRKILVVETKDGVLGFFQAVWLPGSCHDATA